MKQIITVKNTILLIVIVLVLARYVYLSFYLASEGLIEMAAGFIMGIIYMAFLFIGLKCLSYLYNEAESWIVEHKIKEIYDSLKREV